MLMFKSLSFFSERIQFSETSMQLRACQQEPCLQSGWRKQMHFDCKKIIRPFCVGHCKLISKQIWKGASIYE